MCRLAWLLSLMGQYIRWRQVGKSFWLFLFVDSLIFLDLSTQLFARQQRFCHSSSQSALFAVNLDKNTENDSTKRSQRSRHRKLLQVQAVVPQVHPWRGDPHWLAYRIYRHAFCHVIRVISHKFAKFAKFAGLASLEVITLQASLWLWGSHCSSWTGCGAKRRSVCSAAQGSLTMHWEFIADLCRYGYVVQPFATELDNRLDARTRPWWICVLVFWPFALAGHCDSLRFRRVQTLRPNSATTMPRAWLLWWSLCSAKSVSLSPWFRGHCSLGMNFFCPSVPGYFWSLF